LDSISVLVVGEAEGEGEGKKNMKDGKRGKAIDHLQS
jgi:hypothetical protein